MALGLDAETLLDDSDDGNARVHADGDPDLRFHRVLVDAEKRLDALGVLWGGGFAFIVWAKG